VKLLLDNNLSPFLLQSLKTDFPDSLHCADVQLQRSDDLAIWNYAKENHFAIVTKDSDFNALVTLFGFSTAYCMDSARQLFYERDRTTSPRQHTSSTLIS
jgi:predicted nuclease of predicted toxin-antitoxin system